MFQSCFIGDEQFGQQHHNPYHSTSSSSRHVIGDGGGAAQSSVPTSGDSQHFLCQIQTSWKQALICRFKCQDFQLLQDDDRCPAWYLVILDLRCPADSLMRKWVCSGCVSRPRKHSNPRYGTTGLFLAATTPGHKHEIVGNHHQPLPSSALSPQSHNSHLSPPEEKDH